VLPALIRKFHEGKVEGKKEVVLWGTGSPMREFLYVDDLAEALLFLMHSYSGESHINVGTGEDVTIRDLADTVKTVTGYTGTIVWDPSVPDGTPRKLLNVEKIHALGWHHRTDLPDGIRRVYDWYRGNPPCS
jgi:GDP-L-fucose synthase